METWDSVNSGLQEYERFDSQTLRQQELSCLRS